MKTVFTNGCFDVLHRGHIELLRHCKSLGYVVVGLNSDSSIRRLKGENRPFNNQKDRKFLLESCKYVDEVILFSEDTPLNLINQVKPDILVKGGDYKKEDVVGYAEVGTTIIFNYVEGYSSTKAIKNFGGR
ncbi:MAG: adenylyltransferase/cytidyltransferase family protein [Candidatus Peribacter sp.]|jgi:rfaE bifunctional protein nucleotidyltransferase chain/domain|nr:adenylyltransferase/cytidyltransferase family protein [Candidatus Peribacter sp.]MBT6053780.1 adenylyltransferase/cytidyltransferase family protein [Candidatus Scalindua sp.]MDB4335945.1 adenylyltransferase/cytidyltransferase family protein [bacterium]